jgi:hypothetical protein
LAFHSGREADHSPPSSAEVKAWVKQYLHSPNTPSWRGAHLGGAQGTTFTFTFYLPWSVPHFRFLYYGFEHATFVLSLCVLHPTPTHSSLSP